jgi:hypothetical protein
LLTILVLVLASIVTKEKGVERSLSTRLVSQSKRKPASKPPELLAVADEVIEWQISNVELGW